MFVLLPISIINKKWCSALKYKLNDAIPIKSLITVKLGILVYNRDQRE